MLTPPSPLSLTDINQVDGDSNSLLHWTTVYKRLEMTQALIGKGINKDLKNSEGKTALEVRPPHTPRSRAARPHPASFLLHRLPRWASPRTLPLSTSRTFSSRASCRRPTKRFTLCLHSPEYVVEERFVVVQRVAGRLAAWSVCCRGLLLLRVHRHALRCTHLHRFRFCCCNLLQQLLPPVQ